VVAPLLALPFRVGYFRVLIGVVVRRRRPSGGKRGGGGWANVMSSMQPCELPSLASCGVGRGTVAAAPWFSQSVGRSRLVAL
jgi:hypothetical protein